MIFISILLTLTLSLVGAGAAAMDQLIRLGRIDRSFLKETWFTWKVTWKGGKLFPFPYPLNAWHTYQGLTWWGAFFLGLIVAEATWWQALATIVAWWQLRNFWMHWGLMKKEEKTWWFFPELYNLFKGTKSL